ncbi:MAG: HPr family phosphocarrier protein [Lachnospiraceae bacterium]|nr:HPr family phosphocarrier protein [Lachnospiraceae bacterium]
MISKDMVVKIKDGLNVGTVALFIQEASQFDSSIYLEYDNKKVNAKSIMGMMTLNVESGEEISVSADGEDEDAALNSIEKYLCCVQ